MTDSVLLQAFIYLAAAVIGVPIAKKVGLGAVLALPISFLAARNLMGTNPLRGEPAPGLPRFVDLTRVYDAGLRRLLERELLEERRVFGPNPPGPGTVVGEKVAQFFHAR